MGSCETKIKQRKRIDSDKQQYNPISKLLNEYSIEELKNEWGRDEFQLMIQRIKCKKANGYNIHEFISLFPALQKYSTRTKRRIFSLCNRQGGEKIKSKEIVEVLTIIHKSNDEQLLSRIIFYIYREEKQPLMSEGNFSLFIDQNSEHLLDKYQLRKPTIRDRQNRNPIISQDQFCQFVKKFYNLNSFVQLFTENLKQIEEEIVQLLRLNQVINRKKGDRVYIFQYKWYLQWIQYMQQTYNIEVKIEDQLPNKQENKPIIPVKKSSLQRNGHSSKQPKKPGFIKNSALLNDNLFQLKSNLIEFIDFVFLPQNLSQKILTIFKADHTIKRTFPYLNPFMVHEVFIDRNIGYLDRRIENYRAQSNHFSLAQILKENKRQIGEKICMYKAPGSEDWEQLEDLRTPLKQMVERKRVFVTFIRPEDKRLFLKINNVQILDGKKSLKNRIKNYGTKVDFPFKGVTKTGIVIGFQKDSIYVEFKLTDTSYSRCWIPYSVLKDYNPEELNKKIKKNHLAGLKNFNNNCYINAVLQCMIRTPLFGEYLNKESYAEKNKQELILYSIYKVFRQTDQVQVIQTKELKEAIERHFPLFEGDNHQDAQELLSAILSRISEEIKSLEEFRKGKNPQIGGERNKRIIQFFSGVSVIQNECMVCKTKNQKKEHFFTYPLSLPEHKTDEIYFTYFPKLKKSWKPISYGLTLQKQARNEEFIQAASNLIGKGKKKLLFMCVSNGEWVGNLESQPFRQIHSYKNFQIEIVCYEVENENQEVESAVKQQNLTVKLQLQLRYEEEEGKTYKKLFRYPFLLQISNKTPWSSLKYEIEQILFKHKVSQYLSFVRPNNQREESNNSIFQIRYLSKARQSNRCFNCNHPFKSFYGKQWFYERVCSCPQFQDDIILLKNPKIVKCLEKNLYFSVDVRNKETLKLPQQNEIHQSFEKAEKAGQARKDNLITVITNNFENKEEVQLKCQNSKCQGLKVLRTQNISVFPNILLLHLTRFRYQAGVMVKMQNNVIYPEVLDYRGIQYVLYAVVVHKGHCNGGHYYSFVKCGRLWFKCDDEVVSLDKEGEHINPDAYILFFHKFDFQPSLQSLRL